MLVQLKLKTAVSCALGSCIQYVYEAQGSAEATFEQKCMYLAHIVMAVELD